MICNILPTPIYVEPYQLENKQEFIDLAINLSKNDTNYNGYYTNNQLHKKKEFSELCDGILNHIKKYLNELEYESKDGSEGKFKFSRMWITNFRKGNSVTLHNHAGQGGTISGVLYLDLPHDEEQGLQFYPNHIPFSEKVPLKTNFSDIVYVANDTLVLFPSELTHSGMINSSEKNRINISFDVVYNDNLYGPIID